MAARYLILEQVPMGQSSDIYIYSFTSLRTVSKPFRIEYIMFYIQTISLYVTSPIYHTSHGKNWFTTCTVSFYDILRIPFVSHTNLQYTHFLSCIHTYMSISWQIAWLSLMAARYQTHARTLPMWSIGNGLSWIWRWPEAFTTYSFYTLQNRVHHVLHQLFPISVL